MWNQLAVHGVEFNLVREISVFAIEQLRLIWENFATPSLPLRRREKSRDVLMKDAVMRYERLAAAVSRTMERIIAAGGGTISPRPSNSPRFSSAAHTPASTPPLTSRKRMSGSGIALTVNSAGGTESQALASMSSTASIDPSPDRTYIATKEDSVGEKSKISYDGYSFGVLLLLCAIAYSLGMLSSMPSWSI